MSTISRSPRTHVLALGQHDAAEHGDQVGPGVEHRGFAGHHLVLLGHHDIALGFEPADRRTAAGTGVAAGIGAIWPLRPALRRRRRRRCPDRRTPPAILDVMVVSPCTTLTLPAKVASFFLSRTSSVADSIWIGWSRFCEKPCIALGTPVHRALARRLSIRPACSASAHGRPARDPAVEVLRGQTIIIGIISRWRLPEHGPRPWRPAPVRPRRARRPRVPTSRRIRFITTSPSNRTTSPRSVILQPVGRAACRSAV